MLRAYLRKGGVFPDDICADKVMEFHTVMFADIFQQAFSSHEFTETETIVANVRTYKGRSRL